MGTSPSKQRRHLQPPAPHPGHGPAHGSPRPAAKPATPRMTKFTNRKDVMISYSHQDMNVMRKLETALKEAGVSVWVDENALTPGAVFLREIGEAIVASKLFIVLLSGDSIHSKYCQDEVSLAYISNKNIFAVSTLPYDDINEEMDLGMKLTLSCVQWTFLNENEAEALSIFVASVRSALNRIEQEEAGLSQDEVERNDKSDESTDEEFTNTTIMNKQALRFRLEGNQDSRLLPRSMSVEDNLVASEFWKMKFGESKIVEWTKFVEEMQGHTREMWIQLSVSDETIKHLLTLMAKEMNVRNGKLQYRNYILFCTKGKEVVAFDEAISLFAAAAVAVQNVFQIDSSVRLTAIENLGDHQSKAVINVLLDLLYDEDQDVRVVAAISLAHAASEIKSTKTRSEVVNGLLSCLNNDDRLVRESGCLALGRMRSKAAIKKLVFLWRNDYISTVREAAKIAIEQIGGDEAEQALHVTRVLGEEIQKLRT